MEIAEWILLGFAFASVSLAIIAFVCWLTKSLRLKTKQTKKHQQKPNKEFNLEQIWGQFHKTHGDHFRNLLMEHYRHLVRYVAMRLQSKLPSKVELDDLISAGTFGLMDSIEAYDPDRGVKFETYCLPRIKGSILDELRSMDYVPRLISIRKHQLARATKALEASLGHKPTEQEIAKELNMSMDEINRLKQDANSDSQVSPNTKHINIEAQKRDLKNLLTKGLTRAERLIVVLYYYDEMTMKEIGTTLGLSESRVSQMHSSIIARLKAQMKKPREPGKDWSRNALQQPRKQHYLFAHHTLRDLFFNTPEVAIDRLRNDKGRVFLLETWDKAGKDLGALNLVAPRGLHHEIRMYDDNTTVVLITLPTPNVLSEAYFAALIYRPQKKKQENIIRFILLEYSVPFGYGNLSNVLHEWTVDGVHKNIGYGSETTLEAFYTAVCNLL